jgi:hypothetical protein
MWFSLTAQVDGCREGQVVGTEFQSLADLLRALACDQGRRGFAQLLRDLFGRLSFASY